MASQTTPATVADRVDAHYAAALQAVRLAARDHQAHAAKIAAAHGTERGVWQASATWPPATGTARWAQPPPSKDSPTCSALPSPTTADASSHRNGADPAPTAAALTQLADRVWVVAAVTP